MCFLLSHRTHTETKSQTQHKENLVGELGAGHLRHCIIQWPQNGTDLLSTGLSLGRGTLGFHTMSMFCRWSPWKIGFFSHFDLAWLWILGIGLYNYIVKWSYSGKLYLGKTKVCDDDVALSVKKQILRLQVSEKRSGCLRTIIFPCSLTHRYAMESEWRYSKAETISAE